jgi:hypothetical protein
MRFEAGNTKLSNLSPKSARFSHKAIAIPEHALAAEDLDEIKVAWNIDATFKFS